jgi:hypothetical protein
MEKLRKYSPSITFGIPDPVMNTVTVFRVLPDNTTEPIGKIFPDLNSGEDSLIYISTDNQGVQIFHPTADFIEIEKRFRTFADELSKRNFMEQKMAEADQVSERESALEKIRSLKTGEIQHIIK